MRLGVSAVGLSLFLMGCDAGLFSRAPEDVVEPAEEVTADIALASDTEGTLPDAPRRGFLGGLFSRNPEDDAKLRDPNAVKGAVGEIALIGGVVARAPAGYCVDAEASAQTNRRVAILASCANVSGDGSAAEAASAIMTVTVGRLRMLGGPGIDGQSLAQAFQDDVPRAAEGADGLAIVQLEKGGDRTIPGASPVHWRGVVQIGPRLVGLAVYVPKGSALVGAPGGALLRDLAAGVNDASVAARDGIETADAR